MTSAKKIKIVEVGPRDGLQNEDITLATATKIDFINRLSQTGLSVIEVTSFVSPQRIPQLADHSEVMEAIKRQAGVHYPALVPNMEGFETAMSAGCEEIAVFCSASETFSQKNINCSIAESFQRMAAVCTAAKAKHIPVRAYISCVLGCPYEGPIAINSVVDIAERLIKLGCYEISLGDTIGVGTIETSTALIKALSKKVAVDKLAVHFHDTFGNALDNIKACIGLDISTVDSSVAGLGGCPYAEGAKGNVATEDVVVMLNDLKLETGVDLNKLLEVGKYICHELGHPPRSKLLNANLL